MLPFKNTSLWINISINKKKKIVCKSHNYNFILMYNFLHHIVLGTDKTMSIYSVPYTYINLFCLHTDAHIPQCGICCYKTYCTDEEILGGYMYRTTCVSMCVLLGKVEMISQLSLTDSLSIWHYN